MANGGIMLILKELRGYELEKAQPNTSEDFFSRSEVVYVENGVEKTLHVLYVKFFEESLEQYSPYQNQPLFTVEDRDISLKDIIGLVFLLYHPEGNIRKRIYVKDFQEFTKYLKKVDYNKLELIVNELHKHNSYHIGA